MAFPQRISRRTSEHASTGPDASCSPWPEYASAVVEIVMDGRHFVLTPLARETPEPRTRAGDGPVVSDARGAPIEPPPSTLRRPPVMVLTAGDPYPAELSQAENAARMELLCAALDATGIEHDPALGRSKDGSTSEISRALRGVDRAEALDIAGRFGQLAVYEIDDRIRCVDVATGKVVTVRDYDLRDEPAGSDELLGPTGWRG
jgi:hypothetical protein